MSDRCITFDVVVICCLVLLRLQLMVSYNLANVFPYVGFMAAGFQGFSGDDAGEDEIPLLC